MAPMSAPAANAFSLPVTTMQPIAGVGVEGLERGAQLVHQLVVQRVELLGPVQRDHAHAAAFGTHLYQFITSYASPVHV